MPAVLLILVLKLVQLYIWLVWEVAKRATFLSVGVVAGVLAVQQGLQPMTSVTCGAAAAFLLWLGTRQLRRFAEGQRWDRPVLYHLLRSVEILIVSSGPFLIPQGLVLSLMGPETGAAERAITQVVAGVTVAYAAYRSYDRDLAHAAA